MAGLSVDEKAALVKNLESFGVEQVKQMLPHGRFPPTSESYVIEWLAEKERDAADRAAAAADIASAAADRAVAAAERASAAAERQADAAERANTRAMLAIAIAIISMIISAIIASAGIWITHNDAGRTTTWQENPG
jgi:hypothetical protein